jgi:hypothetical protein
VAAQISRHLIPVPDDADLHTDSQGLPIHVTLEHNLKDMSRVVMARELRLALAANVEISAMNATEARTSQTTLSTYAALCKWMECSLATKANLFRSDFRELPAFHTCLIWSCRVPIKGMATTGLLITAVVGLTAFHGIAAVYL